MLIGSLMHATAIKAPRGIARVLLIAFLGLVSAGVAARADTPPSPQETSAAVHALLAAGKLDEAAAAADALIRRTPDDPAAETLRGVVALRKEGIAAARGHFEKSLALDPDFAPATIDLAQTYRVERRLDEARAAYERGLARKPKSLPLLMARAELEFAAGKGDDAILWLERARDADPQAREPRFRLVAAYIGRKDGAKAVGIAGELERLAPRDPLAVTALAESQLANGDRAAAIATFERIVDLTGQAPNALTRLAEILVLDGKAAAASDLMRKAIEAKPDDAQLQSAFVAYSRQSGTIVDGLGVARDLAARAPADPAADELTGLLLEADKRYAEAVTAYAAGLAKSPSSRLTRRLAQALFRAGRAEEARATLAEWLEAQPADRDARLLLAGLLADAGDDAAAVAQYERLAAEYPSDPLPLTELAWLYQLAHDSRAEATAEQALAVAPQSAIVADTLGWILVEKGAMERGTALLRQAALSPAATPSMVYHLAVALDKSGQRADAKELLGKLLQSNAPFAERPAAQKLLEQLGG
jgi:putative PEP-CTERM system TPR-repeat lipoprotein